MALVAKSSNGVFAKRNKALFVVRHRTGLRISELLSLRVRDVYQHGKIIDRVTVERKHMKGGKAGRATGRTGLLHPDARAALSVWLEQLQKRLGGTLAPDTYVFKSRNGANAPISRIQARRILQDAFAANQLTGKLGTHVLRKTFARRMYTQLKGNLMQVQKALGHRSITSTVAYLSFREEEIDEAILAA